MEKLFVYFSAVSLLSAGMVSCNGEDDGRLSGKPVKIRSSDDTDVFFSYQGDRLLKITEKGNGSGTTYEFGYENGELSSLSSRPTDPRIADGDSHSTFKKDADGKITVETAGFSPYFHVWEIELDAHNFPVKITDAGRYSIDEEGLRIKEHDGEYGALFSWNAATGQLLKEEIRRINTSETVATYTYKYDNASGLFSEVDCPLWLYTYWNYNRHFALGTYHALFFGYVNNLAEVTIDDDLNNRHEVLKYVYDYNMDGFPVSVSIQASGGETLTTVQIQY
jgi:hypothetical protein